jgi:hypothetical protein
VEFGSPALEVDRQIWLKKTPVRQLISRTSGATRMRQKKLLKRKFPFPSASFLLLFRSNSLRDNRSHYGAIAKAMPEFRTDAFQVNVRTEIRSLPLFLRPPAVCARPRVTKPPRPSSQSKTGMSCKRGTKTRMSCKRGGSKVQRILILSMQFVTLTHI